MPKSNKFEPSGKKRTFTTENERILIWKRVQEVGMKQAAKEHNLSAKTLENWKHKYGFKLNKTRKTSTIERENSILRERILALQEQFERLKNVARILIS